MVLVKPEINKKDYDDKKQKSQEGFETYQECYPLTDEDGEKVQEYTVTRSMNASVVEDAQSMFMYWLIFLICAVVCSTVFPVLTIYAVKLKNSKIVTEAIC